MKHIFKSYSLAPVSTEPVTLAEVKDYLKIDDTSRDTVITGLIPVARTMIELAGRISIVPREIEVLYDDLEQGLAIPYPKVNSITSIGWINEAGVETPISSSSYTLTDNSVQFSLDFVCNNTLPLAEFRNYQPYRIVANVGYDEAALKQAVLSQLAYMIDSCDCKPDNVLCAESLSVVQLYQDMRYFL